ncbi:MAG: PKD domain-containing protein [Caldisericia bacterium]|nr:PKD domain-containing protein [Caldisericia bacterium]
MVFLRNAILIISMLFTVFPATVNAAGYSISMGASPQTVDIRATSLISLKVTRESVPVANVQIFLGLQGITGQLKSQMILTDKSGEASTVFIPQESGMGYVLAKATINDSGSIISLEAMVQIAARDLNAEPTSFVDQIFPLPGRTGQTMTFVGHGTDVDGKVVKCLWDMGDGKTYEDIGDTSKITHAYEKSGAYLVNFIVTDDRNTISKPVTSKVTVIDNKLPIGQVSGTWPEKANIDQEVIFETNLTDPEGRLSGCRIDFGDGTSQNVDCSGAQATCTFRHKYVRSGEFSVFATPLDDQGSGENFPIPAWKIVVEGEARGGATLTIKGAAGKTINLLGPLPSHQVAFEATLGTETIETGLTMAVGQYLLVAADRSFGFDMQEPVINVSPYISTNIVTSVWTPSIAVETAANHGQKWLNISLVDQTNRLVTRKSVISVSTDDGAINEVLQTSTGNAMMLIREEQVLLKPLIRADFEYVTVTTQKNLQFPANLPDIRLKPVASGDTPEILVTSNISVTGNMNLSWHLWDRILQQSVPVGKVIASAPEEIFVSLIPYRLPVKADKACAGRYLLTVDCQMVVSGTKISDSCQFDPCAEQISMKAAWGISADGNIILSTSVLDKSGKPVSGQRLRIDYEMGRAIGWVPDRNVFLDLPKNTRTNRTGCAWVELDLAAALKDLIIEDVRVTVSTLTSGLARSVTLSIPPPPKQHPILKTTLEDDGTPISTIKLTLLDSAGNAVAGKWVDISYSIGDSKAMQAELGFPPISIRTTHEGLASFMVAKPRNQNLEVFFQADIDGMPVTSVIKISKR